MQVEVNKANRPWIYTLAALASLEMLNILLWMTLSLGFRLLIGSGVITGPDHSLASIVGTYPILLLSPLLTKWYFRSFSLLPLYALNLAQMAIVTWGVVR